MLVEGERPLPDANGVKCWLASLLSASSLVVAFGIDGDVIMAVLEHSLEVSAGSEIIFRLLLRPTELINLLFGPVLTELPA